MDAASKKELGDIRVDDFLAIPCIPEILHIISGRTEQGSGKLRQKGIEIHHYAQ
jgi:hypothetical protein